MEKISGQDLLLELQGKVGLVDKALVQLGKRGETYAEAEKKYRIKLAEKILIERDKGTPVTVISDIARGDREIAKLKFERDVAEITYKSAMEAINCYKIQIRVLSEQLDREWKG